MKSLEKANNFSNFFIEEFDFIRSLLIFVGLIYCGLSVAGNAKVDIEFKGKKSLQYIDVCAGKGEPFRSALFNVGQFECKPNFKEYGGVQLIAQMNDNCDSKIQYDPSTGKVIALDLNYEESSFSRVLNILKEKYGEPADKSNKVFVNPALNVLYQWGDSKGSYINLHIGSVEQLKKGSLNPTVIRYCTILNIRTKEMLDLGSEMDNKREISNKRKIKSDADKL